MTHLLVATNNYNYHIMENRKHILVIDDDPDLSDLLAILLNYKNYNVTSRLSAEGIEQFIEETKPDVLLIDMLMGNFNGAVVCKQIKSNPKIAHIPVIVSSGHNDARDIAFAHCADDFLEKPFNIENFFAVIDKATGM